MKKTISILLLTIGLFGSCFSMDQMNSMDPAPKKDGSTYKSYGFNKIVSLSNEALDQDPFSMFLGQPELLFESLQAWSESRSFDELFSYLFIQETKNPLGLDYHDFFDINTLSNQTLSDSIIFALDQKKIERAKTILRFIQGSASEDSILKLVITSIDSFQKYNDSTLRSSILSIFEEINDEIKSGKNADKTNIFSFLFLPDKVDNLDRFYAQSSESIDLYQELFCKSIFMNSSDMVPAQFLNPTQKIIKTFENKKFPLSSKTENYINTTIIDIIKKKDVKRFSSIEKKTPSFLYKVLESDEYLKGILLNDLYQENSVFNLSNEILQKLPINEDIIKSVFQSKKYNELASMIFNRVDSKETIDLLFRLITQKNDDPSMDQLTNEALGLFDSDTDPTPVLTLFKNLLARKDQQNEKLLEKTIFLFSRKTLKGSIPVVINDLIKSNRFDLIAKFSEKKQIDKKDLFFIINILVEKGLELSVLDILKEKDSATLKMIDDKTLLSLYEKSGSINTSNEDKSVIVKKIRDQIINRNMTLPIRKKLNGETILLRNDSITGEVILGLGETISQVNLQGAMKTVKRYYSHLFDTIKDPLKWVEERSLQLLDMKQDRDVITDQDIKKVVESVGYYKTEETQNILKAAISAIEGNTQNQDTILKNYVLWFKTMKDVVDSNGLYPNGKPIIACEDGMQKYFMYSLKDINPWINTFILITNDKINLIPSNALSYCFDDQVNKEFHIPGSFSQDVYKTAYKQSNNSSDSSFSNLLTSMFIDSYLNLQPMDFKRFDRKMSPVKLNQVSEKTLQNNINIDDGFSLGESQININNDPMVPVKKNIMDPLDKDMGPMVPFNGSINKKRKNPSDEGTLLKGEESLKTSESFFFDEKTTKRLTDKLNLDENRLNTSIRYLFQHVSKIAPDLIDLILDKQEDSVVRQIEKPSNAMMNEKELKALSLKILLSEVDTLIDLIIQGDKKEKSFFYEGLFSNNVEKSVNSSNGLNLILQFKVLELTQGMSDTDFIDLAMELNSTDKATEEQTKKRDEALKRESQDPSFTNISLAKVYKRFDDKFQK